MKRLTVFIIISCFLFGFSSGLYAQMDTDAPPPDFSKQVEQAKSKVDKKNVIISAREYFLKDKKFNEFMVWLDSLKEKKDLELFINYYTGISRYEQLKYLEAQQKWDEYFDKGNEYRRQIQDSLNNVITALPTGDSMSLYAKLSIWQLKKDTQAGGLDESLNDLMNSTVDFAKDAKDLTPIKDIAEKLAIYQERAKANELYRLYSQKVVSLSLSETEIQNAAYGFYKNGNLELAEAVYNIFIDKILKSYHKDKLKLELISLAKLFSFNKQGVYDTVYAERIFKLIEEKCGLDSFDEGLLFLRGFNLEKSKLYTQAKLIYLDFMRQYPQSKRFDESYFKVAMFTAYIDKDIKLALEDFGKIADLETVSPQAVSSLYQIGLINQWNEELDKAKEAYTKLLEKAKDGFADTAKLAQERLKEIEDKKPLDYSVKLFLDAVLKENLDSKKVDIKVSSYRPKPEDEVRVSSNVALDESGCLEMQLQYFWSGHLGEAAPDFDQNEFTSVYKQAGSKEINLVVVSPSGIIDWNIDFVDVE